MLRKHLVETIMGGFVLIVAAIFLAFAYTSADLSPAGGYQLTASFSSVDGLTTGSDVRAAGVKVGVVTSEAIDPKDFRALVHMNLQARVKVPTDTKAVIASAGLLGGKYIKLELGHDSNVVAAGGDIKNTEGAVVLEELLGKIIFLVTNDQNQSQEPAPAAAQPPAAQSPAGGDKAPDAAAPAK